MNLFRGFPKHIEEIYKKFSESDHELYLVGGSIRNLLLHKDIEDWDMTTDATPEQILKLFPNAFYDNLFGTVGIPVEKSPTGKTVVEVTTFRTEEGFSDRRHPEKIYWGKSIEEDLERRDFTVNAVALKISGLGDKLSVSTSSLIDPFGGQKDIEKKTIRAVGDPSKRFKEDALRLIRAIRIASEYGFVIEKKTWQEVQNDAPLIENISGERIRTELLKILETQYPHEGILLLRNANLLQYLIPELLEGVGVSQQRPGRHHTTDVFTHNLLSLKYCPSKDPIVRFAALLHDIGKPKVAGKDEEGLIVFYNHEIVGARITQNICDRLRFSKKERSKVYTLIRWHMFTVDEKITDAAVRRFIRRVGVENVKDMIDVRIGDRLGGGTQTAESWRLKLFKKRLEDQLKPAPFSINDMAIDGNDIMKELNIKPSKKVGEILQKLFEDVDEDLSKNNKNYLLKRTRELAKA